MMQGNASDLITGLPLQSVYKNDTEAYHELQRLFVIVYAPRQLLSLIIHAQPTLRKIFGNGWARLTCKPTGKNVDGPAVCAKMILLNLP